ncbi:MAG: hypothetical protein HY721_24330 [Planctomycetes bacterium]|nr:hypothetical protein [Planctomycetota bacterium]
MTAVPRSWRRLTAPLLLVTLAAAGPAASREVEIRIDVSKPGPAIHPYVYGQFIEHLGRCIRGGIWAEMLRDRKLLLEPGKSWEVVKPEGALFEVLHDTAGAYCGERCTALWARDPKGGRCGIRQGGLGIVAGKEYVGRAVLAHAGEPAPVEVRLSWGDGAAAGESVDLADVGSSYRTFPFRFRAGATTDAAVLSITVSRPAYLWVACLSLMPADNVKGMRPDTLELIRRLAPPITRWPGGNFVSGYLWKDAIGDRDRRPPRWERAWSDVEDNDFGLDEFLDFCDAVKTEPYIAVNSGLGSVADAADEVEYSNGPPESRWGSERARNGRTAPYRVAWWGIGNEMYGSWQLGNVPAERYALRHEAFVRALRERDPGIKVIAVGAPGAWNDVIVPRCASSMDLLSAHHYSERRFRLPLTPEDARMYEEGFLAYSGSVAQGVRGLVEDLRRRRGKGDAAADRLRLAVDEWGIVRDWNSAPDGPGIGAFEHYYSLGDAIAVARGLHEILRSADLVTMANWAQAVNVIGAIKTSRTAAALDPVGHVLALYRHRVGDRLVPIAAAGDAPVDAIAGWRGETSDEGTLSVALVNYSPGEAVAARIEVEGARGGGTRHAWRIEGPSLGATNVPGKPEEVTTRELHALPPVAEPLLLPPRSITVVEATWP